VDIDTALQAVCGTGAPTGTRCSHPKW
jgi:hypothetical protein